MGEVLNVASPSPLACCRLDVAGSGGWGSIVRESRGAFGGVLRRCLDSPHSVVVALSAVTGGVGFSRGAVSELGGAFGVSEQASSGGVSGSCLGSSPSMDVAMLALTGRDGCFCSVVLQFGVVVVLPFLSMSGGVLLASVLAGCCSG